MHELEQAQQLAEAQQLRLEHQQRAAHKLRLVIAGLAAVAVIAALACIAALVANQRANKLAVAARQNEEKAGRTRRIATKREEGGGIPAGDREGSPSSHRRSGKSRGACPRPRRPSGWPRRRGGGPQATVHDRHATAPFVWDDRTTADQLRVLLAKHVPSGRTRDERMKDEGKDEGGKHGGRRVWFILHPSAFILSEVL